MFFGKINANNKCTNEINTIQIDTTNFEQTINKLKLDFIKYNVKKNYTKKILRNNEVWKIMQISNQTKIINISYIKKQVSFNENYYIKKNILVYSKKTKDTKNFDFQEKCEYFYINEDIRTTEMAMQSCIQYPENECDDIVILEEYEKRIEELKKIMKNNE